MSDVTIKKETKEFFVFSYFNILPEKLFKEKEKTDKKSDYQAYVAYQCSYRAYRDVCRTIHYAYTSEDLKAKKKGWEDFENLKKAFIQYEINLILEEIKSIPNTNDSFNNWHNNLCDYMLVDNDNFKEKLKIDTEVKQLFKHNEGDKEKNCFKYGMAQKWLNMTIKNILLVEDMFKGITEYDLEKNKKNFHVPVDKNILKAAKDLGIKQPNEKCYSIDGWSNWDEDTYKNFTEALNKRIQNNTEYTCPLDWEHSAWIKFAE